MSRYAEDNENDNICNEYRISPPFPFRYGSPGSRSLSITDVTYEPGNNNTAVNSDDNDYDDVEDENPRKRLLKQMFCLPLH